MRRLIVLLLAGALAATAFATAGEIVPLDDRYTIELFDGWAIEDEGFAPLFPLVDDEIETFVLTYDTLTLILLSPDHAAALGLDLSREDLRDTLARGFRRLYGYSLPFDEIEEATLGDNPAALWAYETADSDGNPLTGVTLAVDSVFADGLVIADAYGPPDVFEEQRSVIDMLVMSLALDPDAPRTPTSGIRPTPPPRRTAIPANACTVSTPLVRTVPLRVGPSSDRGTFTYMPAATPLTVVGRTNDAAGALWYEIDRTQIENGGNAQALWVEAASVTAAGPCGDVPTTAAPPVVRPQPTSVPGGSINTGLPQSGSWTLTLKPQYTAICAGFPVTGDLRDISPELAAAALPGLLSISPDGSVLTFRTLGVDYAFARTTPGIYAGPLQLGELSTQATLTVISTTLIDLIVRDEFPVGRVSCQVTLGGLLTP